MESANKPSRLFIPQPFASADGAAMLPIENASSNNPNFPDGFPSVFSAPKSGGGSYITRGMINAIGNLASRNQFCAACGGIITFDRELSNKIGGYYRGAILQYVSGTQMFFVMSLVDNNEIDFTDPEVGIDGINWKIVGGGSNSFAPSWSRKNSSVLAGGTELPQSGDPVLLASGRFPSSGYVRAFYSGTYTVPQSGTDGMRILMLIGGSAISELPESIDDFGDNSDCELFNVAALGNGYDVTDEDRIVPVSVGIPYSIWIQKLNTPSISSLKYSVRFYG